jgi:hypothetical protein
MKIDGVASQYLPKMATEEPPVINADQIKSILYLGIKGNISSVVGNKHTVDTYA